MAHPAQNNEIANVAQAHTTGTVEPQPWSYIDILQGMTLSRPEVVAGVGIAAGATASMLGTNRLESAMIGVGVGGAAAMFGGKSVEAGKKAIGADVSGILSSAADVSGILGSAAVGGFAIDGAARTAKALAGKAGFDGIIEGAKGAYKKMYYDEAAGFAAGAATAAALTTIGQAEAVGMVAGGAALAALANQKKFDATAREAALGAVAGAAAVEAGMLGPAGLAVGGAAAAAAEMIRHGFKGGEKAVPKGTDLSPGKKMIVPAEGHLYIPELWR